jgi:hypothetical protein
LGCRPGARSGLMDLWIGWDEPQSICWLQSASERVDGKWDTKVFEERAKEKNKERYERAKEHEEAAKTGTSGLLLPSSFLSSPARFLLTSSTPALLPLTGKKVRRKNDLPKPTQAAQAREAPLNLEANLNKTLVVSNSTGRGPGQPGFYVSVPLIRPRLPACWSGSNVRLLSLFSVIFAGESRRTR